MLIFMVYLFVMRAFFSVMWPKCMADRGYLSSGKELNFDSIYFGGFPFLAVGGMFTAKWVCSFEIGSTGIRKL